MTTVDQFLKALAVTESSDDPEAWGDAGRAMGRWQIHPDRFFDEVKRLLVQPKVGETWDQVIGRIVAKIFTQHYASDTEVSIAMYWHLGHWTDDTQPDWDAKYAVRFLAALANAQEELA